MRFQQILRFLLRTRLADLVRSIKAESRSAPLEEIR